MQIVLLLLFLFQDASEDKQSLFTPITPGNVIPVGSYNITVPDGCFYAGEEDVPHMFELAAAEYIPNCVGMFFSKSATWEYSITVQHIDFQPFVLEPIFPEEEFVEIFSKSHIYTLRPSEGEGSLISAPHYDPEQGTFSIGFRYAHDDKVGMFIKKIWVGERDGLVMSLKATEPSFNTDFQEIDAVLNSVTRNGEVAQAGTAQPLSYLTLLGLNQAPTEATQVPLEAGDAGIPMELMLLSGFLVLFAAILFLFAVRQSKKARIVNTDE